MSTLVALEGKKPAHLFSSHPGDYFRNIMLMDAVRRHLEAGKFVHIEFTKGSRKGAIGRLELDATAINTLYKKNTHNSDAVLTRKDFQIVFDDRSNKIKVEVAYYNSNGGWPADTVLRFDKTETVWAFTKTVRPAQEAATLHDHFGVVLEVGQLILYPEGRAGDLSTRFGYITEITAKGSIRIKSVKTRKHHQVEEKLFSPAMSASDIVVLDGDINAKALMAKLTHG